MVKGVAEGCEHKSTPKLGGVWTQLHTKARRGVNTIAHTARQAAITACISMCLCRAHNELLLVLRPRWVVRLSTKFQESSEAVPVLLSLLCWLFRKLNYERSMSQSEVMTKVGQG